MKKGEDQSQDMSVVKEEKNWEVKDDGFGLA